MPNYNNGRIYKIYSPSHPDEIYIGSTTQPLAKRIGGHRGNYKKYKAGNAKKYITSYKILEYPDAKIELIEKVECSCREELVAREGYFIRTLDCVNKVIPTRTMKEWYEDNKGDILEQQKQYREDNKDKISQRKKQYYKDNKEAYKQYREDNKNQIARRMKQYREDNKEKLAQYHKQYHQDNKEMLAQKDKQYYQKNKEKIKARASEKVTCECGVVVTRGVIARHKKSKRHLQALKTAEHLTT